MISKLFMSDLNDGSQHDTLVMAVTPFVPCFAKLSAKFMNSICWKIQQATTNSLPSLNAVRFQQVITF